MHDSVPVLVSKWACLFESHYKCSLVLNRVFAETQTNYLTGIAVVNKGKKGLLYAEALLLHLRKKILLSKREGEKHQSNPQKNIYRSLIMILSPAAIVL